MVPSEVLLRALWALFESAPPECGNGIEEHG